MACGISIKATAKLFLCTLCRHLVSGGTHYGPQHYVEVTVVFFPGGSFHFILRCVGPSVGMGVCR